MSAPKQPDGIEILARLSSGGMGEVLLARRIGAGGFEKLIALKTIRADLVHSDQVRRMFLDEARLVARLSHPAIAQVYDFGELDGSLYLAMEYVPGVGLSRLIKKRDQPLPPLAAAQIAVQVCEGLHAAHELKNRDNEPLGVVHRDVTPQNLILGFDGRMRILDFGIALMRDREAPETEYGVVKGKPSYMAPEQLRHQHVDRRADIYGISVVLHELLTGERLFPEDSILATAKAIEKGSIDPPSKRSPDVPRELDAIVLQGLAREPGQRFADARQMALALEQVVQANEGTLLPEFVEAELVDEKSRHWQRLQAVLDGKPMRPSEDDDEAPTIVTQGTPLGPDGRDAATVFSRMRSEQDPNLEVVFRPGPAEMTMQHVASDGPPTPSQPPSAGPSSPKRSSVSPPARPSSELYAAAAPRVPDKDRPLKILALIVLFGVLVLLSAYITKVSREAPDPPETSAPRN